MVDIPIKCNIDYIQNYLQFGYLNQCQFVEKHCTEKDGYMFLNAYYCMIGESTLMLIIFTVVFCFIAFHLLSSTAENYLSPALTNISNKLGLSETLAGVTLVAIGNGAPDVIVAFNASSGGGDEDDEDDGISFTVGSIFGAGIFVTTMCLALVLVKSGGGLQPNKNMFLRDMVFYMIAVIVILIYGFIGSIQWYQAVAFIAIYIIYIIVVVIMEHQENKKQKEQEQLKEKPQIEQTQSEMLEAKLYTEEEIERKHQEQIEKKPDQDDLQTSEIDNQEQAKQSQNQTLTIQEENGNKIRVSINDGNADGNNSEYEELSPQKPQSQQQQNSTEQKEINLHQSLKEDHYKSKDNQFLTESQSDLTKSKTKKKQSFVKLRHNIRLKLLKTKTEWVDLEFEDKLIYIWEIPANFIRDITIAPSEENWKRWRAAISCIGGPIFFLISGLLGDVVDPFDADIWWVYLIIGCVGLFLGIIVWKTSHKSNPPSYVWVFSTMAFIISIAWINAVADLLIEFLSFIQIITEINKVYLGMTFLAYGNSAGDYFTNGQLATMGYGNMALTACYAGQLFNLLIGFGLTMILGSTQQGGMEFDLFGFNTKQNTSQAIGGAIGYGIVFCALINVVIVIIYSFFTKFVYGKTIGNFLRMFYLLLIIAATVMGIASDIVKPNFQDLIPINPQIQ